jgi:hypothetical protein
MSGSLRCAGALLVLAAFALGAAGTAVSALAHEPPCHESGDGGAPAGGAPPCHETTPALCCDGPRAANTVAAPIAPAAPAGLAPFAALCARPELSRALPAAAEQPPLPLLLRIALLRI